MGADPAVEEHFGPYLVYERLGVGGMATVHRALERHDGGFERMVALKRLLPHLAEDASFIKSFVREARLASILNHVNIVEIYELGRVGTQYFITMEYIDGRDVRAILRHARRVAGPPPIHVTVGLALQLAEALEYAHSKVDEEGQPLGLVHRDVSPSNLLVTTSGHLKIIDFGIAKAETSQMRTETGRAKGKLAYMAPEAIASGRDLDARSDIWAFGVILHEVLCARPLFASKNDYLTLLKVQKGEIAKPSQLNSACPPELDAVVMTALARDPERRFAYARDVRDALLAVKKQYSLQTGYRDIAQWIEWAFAQKEPESATPTEKMPKLDRPDDAEATSTNDEESVEAVWGSAEQEEKEGPVLLDDVPDVSRKHQASQPPATQKVVRGADLEIAGDDIPAHQPTHGALPHAAAPAQAAQAAQAPQRDTNPGMSAGRTPTPMSLPSPMSVLGKSRPAPRAPSPDPHESFGDTALAQQDSLGEHSTTVSALDAKQLFDDPTGAGAASLSRPTPTPLPMPMPQPAALPVVRFTKPQAAVAPPAPDDDTQPLPILRGAPTSPPATITPSDAASMETKPGMGVAPLRVDRTKSATASPNVMSMPSPGAPAAGTSLAQPKRRWWLFAIIAVLLLGGVAALVFSFVL